MALAFTACPDKIIVATEANCISFSSIYGLDFYRFDNVVPGHELWPFRAHKKKTLLFDGEDKGVFNVET